MPYYAVANGKNPGVYNTWSECESQVKGYHNAKYKKFSTMSEANEFCGMGGNRGGGGGGGYSSQSGYSGGYSRQPSYSGGYSSQPSHSSGYSGYSDNQKVHHSTVGYAVCSAIPGSQQSGCSSSRSRPVVYTDGACINNGQFGAKAGYGNYWGPNHPDNVSLPLEGKQTNNRAEIQAAVKAINTAKARGHDSVTVRTDSEFLMNGVNWSKKWSQNGWKLSTGGPVKNKDDFIALIDAMKSIDVKFEKVPAHSGDYGNEMADRFAFAGAKKSY